MEDTTDVKGFDFASECYSLRGVINNSLHSKVKSKLRIGLLCIHRSTFPSWLFTCSPLLHEVLWLVLHENSNWRTLIQQLKPMVPILFSIPCDCDANIIFCDGALPGSNASIWSSASLHTLVCTALPRSRIRNPWTMWKFHIPHSHVGGVSDGSFYIYRFTKQSGALPLSYLKQPHRDVSSVICPTTSGGVEAQPSLQSPRKIPTLWRTNCGVLSHFGLFPLQARRQKFLVPSVFSSTKWVHRRLSLAEQLHVFDVPLTLLKTLSASNLRQLQLDLKIPLKILVSVLDPCLQACSITPSIQAGGDCSLSPKPKLLAQNQIQLDAKPMATDIKSEDADNIISFHDTSKATKSDDAAVPTYIWDSRISMEPSVRHALDKIRTLALRWWKRKLLRSFIHWLFSSEGPCYKVKRKQVKEWVIWKRNKSRFEWSSTGKFGYEKATRKIWKIATKDMEAGQECIARAGNSSWWDWSDGSRPFFWRWSKDFQILIRDGVPPLLSEVPDRWVNPQQCDRKSEAKVKLKLHKVWKVRRYLEKGFVQNLTRFFAVPKGESDIRMVYDSTVANLNNCLWAPWFAMPTIRNHLRAIGPGAFMADVDIGEMFLNFPMHPSIRPYCGVDLTKYFPELVGNGKVLWVRWTRCCMGLKTSPYNCVQGMMHLSEAIFGDRKNESNPFRWDKIKLNLPGLADYDPSLPWVYKERKDGSIACDVFTYVDDLRPTGPTEEECWAATRRTGSIINHHGVQDASRKRRPPSQTPGAWAGSVISTDSEQVLVEVAQDKWDKTKKYLDWIVKNYCEEDGIPFKQLERIRGFLVYTTRTYPAMVPYLKGIHLTLDGWRKHRDPEGWKYIGIKWEEDEGLEDLLEEDVDGPPDKVMPVPRLKADIEALQFLTSPELAPKRIIRSKKVISVVYGFGDASGKGFGTGVKIEGELFYRFGEWCTGVSELSSNYRELYNLVLGIKELAEKGKLESSEIFLFTDNSTAEGAFFRGTSSNRRLFELILNLRKLEHDHGFILHVIHVAGSRMIASGIDGLSRGDTTEGILAGENVLSFVPLHLSAAERCPKLLEWIKTWYNVDHEVLTPEGWFTTGHEGDRSFVWMPAPAAAEVALEQLCLARLKRPSSSHLFVVPRLLTAYWRKQLGKLSDCMFVIPIGLQWWTTNMFEPVYLALVLPLTRSNPWCLKGSQLVGTLEGELRSLWTSVPERSGAVLRKFLQRTRTLDTLPKGVVRSLLQPTFKRQLSYSGSRKRRRISTGET